MNPMCHTLPYHSLLILACGGMLSLGRSFLSLLSLLANRSLTLINDELQLSVDEVILWQHGKLGFKQGLVWWNSVWAVVGMVCPWWVDKGCTS